MTGEVKRLRRLLDRATLNCEHDSEHDRIRHAAGLPCGDRRAPQRLLSPERELAADWCSILAADRATPAWSFKLINPKRDPCHVLRIAWAAWEAADREVWRGGKIRRGRTQDNASERWARAEAILRGGPL